MTSIKTNRGDAGPASTPNHARRSGGRGPVVILSLLLAAAVLVALLGFVAQNSQSVKFSYFGIDATIGFGVALLIAAAAGAVLTALIATVLKIRRSVRNHL